MDEETVRERQLGRELALVSVNERGRKSQLGLEESFFSAGIIGKIL